MASHRARAGRAFVRLAEGLPGAPDVGPVKRWVYGLGLAAIPFGYGVWCLVTNRATLWGRRASLELSGKPAMAMALVWVSLGLFVHSHFLWSTHWRLWRAGYAVKVLSLLGIVGGIGYILYWFVASRGRG